MKLKTLKIYIKTPHLKAGFIWSLKFSVGASIFFDKKPDSSLCLYVNYQSLKNLTVKNWYLLPLIDESLDQARQVKQFT